MKLVFSMSNLKKFIIMNPLIALLISLVVGLVLAAFFMCLNKLCVENYLLESRLKQILDERQMNVNQLSREAGVLRNQTLETIIFPKIKTILD